jgi:alkyl sulfatase BDS1-like metallo-beta-lactamase superfamily hydrolase
VDSSNTKARSLKASNLRHLAYAQTNINWRNWYLTSALELEGNLDRGRLMSFSAPDLVAAYPSEALLGGFRFRVNADKLVADGYRGALTVRVDDGSEHLLVLRNGLLSMSEPSEVQSATSISISRAGLLTLTSARSVQAGLEKSGYHVLSGTEAGVRKFFEYFDDKVAGGVALTLQ